MENHEPKNEIIDEEFEEEIFNPEDKNTLKLFFSKYWMYFLVVFIIICAYFISPIKNVGEVEIEGNNILSDQEIFDLVNYNKKINFITFSTDKWKNKLVESEYIKSATVKKRFFNKVRIKVEEYMSIGCYVKDGEEYILYDSGYYENSQDTNQMCEGIDIHGLQNASDEFITEASSIFREIDVHVLLQISEIVFNFDEKYPNRIKIYMNPVNMQNKGNTIIAELDLLVSKIKTYDTQLEGIRQTYGSDISGIFYYTNSSNEVLFTKYE